MASKSRSHLRISRGTSSVVGVVYAVVGMDPNVKTISGRRHCARLTPASENAMQLVGWAWTTPRTSGRSS